MSLLNDELRALKSLAGPFPGFDPATAPEDPRDLFAAWLRQAIAAGVNEPHAMTLSTVDEAGCLDARVLILKNMDRDGWHFATGRASRKGRQIDSNPRAALHSTGSRLAGRFACEARCGTWGPLRATPIFGPRRRDRGRQRCWPARARS